MPSLDEIGHVVFEKKILKFRDILLANPNYLPLEKCVTLYFNKTWIPFTEGCIVLNLVEIGPVVLEKKMKMWKVYDNVNNNANNNDNDKFWSEKLTWAFGSGELKSRL